MKTKVVNINRETYDVLIDRTTKWGNPYLLTTEDHKERLRVLALYESYVRQIPHLIAALPELVGKRLGCHCAPKPCHGNILVKLIKEHGLEK